MSIIAVHGFELRHKLQDVVKLLAKPINGQFEALNFLIPRGQPKPVLKTCYLRVSEKLDPVRVVQRINDYNYEMRRKLKASIPEKVPDLPLGVKPKRLPMKLRQVLNIPEEDPYEMALNIATDGIMAELQTKYPGLYCLSKKMGHKLLQEISKKVMARVKDIQDNNQGTAMSSFQLSRAYRRAHPHFGDFQFALSTLHAIEDAAGAPRTQLEEAELASVPPHQPPDVPTERLQTLCNKYTEKILKKMTAHIEALPSEVSPTDTGADIARKQVREEFKKLSRYLPNIVNQVVSKNIIPKAVPPHRVMIYGEPSLPAMDTMGSFLVRFKPRRPARSTLVYNLMRVSVPPAHYHSLVAMNGTVLNGSKLLIRSAEVPIYKCQTHCYEADEGEEDVDMGA